jgi:hypothetical protein
VKVKDEHHGVKVLKGESLQDTAMRFCSLRKSESSSECLREIMTGIASQKKRR